MGGGKDLARAARVVEAAGVKDDDKGAPSGASTRPGTLPPEYLELLPAVAAALRARHIPGTTAAGRAVAADVLDDMAARRDPRARFDAGKSTRKRDMFATAVLDQFSAGRGFAQAIKSVAAEYAVTERNVREHLRGYLAELWPGPITHARPDGTRETWPATPGRRKTEDD